MSTENCFRGIVRNHTFEIVNYLLRGVVTHRMRTLSVIHTILNTTLCDDKNEMFHSGEKLMFLGQVVKLFFQLRIFSHLVNGIRKESVGFSKLSKKAFAFNVRFSKKNDCLTFNVIRFIDF
jgi:hypothetical protein